MLKWPCLFKKGDLNMKKEELYEEEIDKLISVLKESDHIFDVVI